MSYVLAGYALVFVSLGTYTWRVLARQRTLSHALHPDEDASP